MSVISDWKTPILALIEDAEANGHDFNEGDVIYSWEYPDRPEVSVTLILGSDVTEILGDIEEVEYHDDDEDMGGNRCLH